MKDPTPDLYKMFDKCGLTAGTLLSSSQNMNRRITSIRVQLANELKSYMQDREAVKEGEHRDHERPPVI